MNNNDSWKMELSEYIRQGEPSKAAKSMAWQTAIGLQDVDGLKVSNYLLETAKEHIEGSIDIHAAQRRIEGYYEANQSRKSIEQGNYEADIVSSRITELLVEKTFNFSPAEWQTIHRRLFAGVFEHAGKFRDYNITKKEWVLKGATVAYTSCESLIATLNYDFGEEKKFNYEGLSVSEAVKHLAKFTAGIWQIHPFGEGNTRATAIFIIKYLQSFGFNVKNDVFADNSWYFRNALVRANYNDLQNGVYETTRYLEYFFENLLLGKNNELKNRYLHIDYENIENELQKPKTNELNVQYDIPKRQNVVLECRFEELVILKAIKDNPNVTQKDLAKYVRKTSRTVQRIMVTLQEKGYIERVGGKRYGHWVVKVEDNSKNSLEIRNE